MFKNNVNLSFFYYKDKNLLLSKDYDKIYCGKELNDKRTKSFIEYRKHRNR